MTKLDPTGKLVYSTYLGDTGSEEGSGIAVDGARNAYVVGFTDSINFPTTTGAFQGAFRGGFEDAFVTKLDPTGAALVYSTYLGGTGFDEGSGIAVDGAGNAYVTGLTLSPDFPKSSGAFQPSSGGGIDAFVTKLDPTGAALVYSTYLGGTDFDEGDGIAVDATGNAYVTGLTFSTNFPTTTGAFKVTFGGVRDAFVTKLDPTGAALVYSTYLGGSGEDSGFGIAVDKAGSAYVTGETFSADFPTTAGALQPGGDNDDAFVTKLDPTGAALVYSTFLGGSSSDFGFGIAVDADGNAYVTGVTNSPDFPTLQAFQASFRGTGDSFVTKFSFGNTQPGTGVKIQLGQVTVTFANVTAAGNTTVTVITNPTEPPTPAGFTLGVPPTYYNLATTASFTGLVTGCINYTGIAFDNEASLKLFHFEHTNNDTVADTWVDRTVSLDTASNIICADVTSLSPFAIVDPAIQQIQPFAAFQARVEIEHERHEREFEVKGTFTLGAGSDGIDPLKEDVPLQVGAFTATIPAGSFRRHGKDTFRFEGVAGGARLEVKIQARGGNRFEFKAEGKGTDLTGTTNPVEVTLTIGNDGGPALRSEAGCAQRGPVLPC